MVVLHAGMDLHVSKSVLCYVQKGIKETREFHLRSALAVETGEKLPYQRL